MMILEPLVWFGKHVGEHMDQLDPSYWDWLIKTQLRGPYHHMIRDVSILAISSDVQVKLTMRSLRIISTYTIDSLKHRRKYGIANNLNAYVE